MDCISDARQTCEPYQFPGSRAPEIQPDGMYFGRAANLLALAISGEPRARNTSGWIVFRTRGEPVGATNLREAARQKYCTARWIVFRTCGKPVGPTNFREAARQKYSQVACISDARQTCGPYQLISVKARARNTTRCIVFRARGEVVGPTTFREAAR